MIDTAFIRSIREGLKQSRKPKEEGTDELSKEYKEMTPGQTDEALDPVNKDAVKKKFKDRRDKDIDNDGDVDSSDKYLHKRRKAISKAMKEMAEEIEGLDERRRDYSNLIPFPDKVLTDFAKRAKKAGLDFDQYTKFVKGTFKDGADEGRAIIKGREIFKDKEDGRKKLSGAEAKRANIARRAALRKRLGIEQTEQEKQQQDPRHDQSPFPPKKKEIEEKMHKGIRLTPELFKNVKKFGVELEKYAKKSGGIDKDDFMKVAAIAKKGMLPDKSDIPSDTDPRDKVLSMMAGIVGDEILLAFKGLSPSIDNYIKKTMKEDTELDEDKKYHYYNLDRGVYRLQKDNNGKIIGKMHDRQKEMRAGFPNADEVLSTTKQAAAKVAKLNEQVGVRKVDFVDGVTEDSPPPVNAAPTAPDSGNIQYQEPVLGKKKKKKKIDEAKIITSTFAGKQVFVVDSDMYHQCRLGKQKYHRYEKYVGNKRIGKAIREYGLKHPKRPIILQNGENGPMLYLRYGRS